MGMYKKLCSKRVPPKWERLHIFTDEKRDSVFAHDPILSSVVFTCVQAVIDKFTTALKVEPVKI